MIDQLNYSLLRHNTFGIEAHCRRYMEFESVAEAQTVASAIAGTPFLIIGGGSNLLLAADFQGTVVRSGIKGIELIAGEGDDVLLRAGSGEVWDDVVRHCVAHGWHGAENLSLIPGDVGATAVQNIGAYGAEAADIIYMVEAVAISDGRLVQMTAGECRYAYRDSRFKHEWRNRYLITHVIFKLSKRFEPRLDYGNIRSELAKQGIAEPSASQLRDVIVGIRRDKLPDTAVEGNAGSFFMNPVVERPLFERIQHDYPLMPHYYVDPDHEKIPAGWMIEQCGWKGRSLGRAGVHNRQALVLVNRGGATGSDVVALCRAIQHDVKERFGIDIQPEVNIV